MGVVLSGLKPAELWGYFEDLANHPRPSKNEAKVVAYVLEFGKKNGFESIQDSVGNIVIKVPATPGMENKRTVVLQGHVDMVCEKNRDVEFDFDTQPIQLQIDGEWVTANGTTLGADNGIGVAAAMAAATAPGVEHGPLELLFTIDEETGLTGAKGLDASLLKGEVLLNLDSEEEGTLYIGCSGGVDTIGTFSFNPRPTDPDDLTFELSITGLKGGHSGLNIIDGRANAIKLLTRLLWNFSRKFHIGLIRIEGGSKRNAIPREASAVFTVTPKHAEELKETVVKCTGALRSENSVMEPDLAITLTAKETPLSMMDTEFKDILLNALYALPHGVFKMSQEIPNLVETSTNLATVELIDGKVVVGTSQRSSVVTEMKDISNKVVAVFELAGADVSQSDGYPGWKPNIHSGVLEILKKSYHELYNAAPEVKAIHAGLECGIIGERYPKMDMISFGPTITGAHSPDERVNIPAVENFWKLLLITLKNV